jgi:Flp pilus assembly protein TadD
MEFYKEHKRYGTFEEIGFRLDGKNNRYTYRIDASGRPGTMISAGIGQATPDNTIVSAGISPDGQAFTATATGQLDNDDTLDQWHVNEIKHDLRRPDVNDITDSIAARDLTLEHAISKVDIQPQDVDAQLSLGRAYADRGQYELAIDWYKAALRLKPDSALAYGRMGYVYGELGRHDDAVKALRQAISLDPSDYRDYSNLGLAYDHLSRYDEAIEVHQQAVRLKPGEAILHNNFGYTLINAKRYEDAVRTLEEAVRLAPDSDLSHYNLSRAYYLKGDREQAQKHYEILKGLNPSKAEALLKAAPM